MEKLNCPIRTLREFKEELEEASTDKKASFILVDMCIGRLVSKGFVEVSDTELAINPLPRSNFEEQKTNIVK